MRRPMPPYRSQHAARVLREHPGDAAAVLEADDQRGASVGLVVQADEIGWSAIDALLDLAVYGRLAHRRTAHAGAGGQDCTMCSAADALWAGALLDPVTARRGTTATALHELVRGQLERDNDE